MPTTDETLDRLIAKLRTLPEDRKTLAIDALSDITEDVYVLSSDERAVLNPALERVHRGEYASDEEMSELLDKPWR